MTEATQETRFELSRPELVAVPAVIGQWVRCLRGVLWLTEEGESRDIILGPGQFWRITHPGTLVISALDDVSFVIGGASAGAVSVLGTGAEAGRLADRQRRWRSPSLASYPATMLR